MNTTVGTDNCLPEPDTCGCAACRSGAIHEKGYRPHTLNVACWCMEWVNSPAITDHLRCRLAGDFGISSQELDAAR